jgi:hypothetical protein
VSKRRASFDTRPRPATQVQFVIRLTEAFEKAGEFAEYADRFFTYDLQDMTKFLGANR